MFANAQAVLVLGYLTMLLNEEAHHPAPGSAHRAMDATRFCEVCEHCEHCA